MRFRDFKHVREYLEENGHRMQSGYYRCESTTIVLWNQKSGKMDFMPFSLDKGQCVNDKDYE